MWVTFALLSAAFAALTSILAKIGIDGVNSNLATAIRTAVVLVLAWGIVLPQAHITVSAASAHAVGFSLSSPALQPVCRGCSIIMPSSSARRQKSCR